MDNVVGHLLDAVCEPVVLRAFEYWRNVDKTLGVRIERGVRAKQDEMDPKAEKQATPARESITVLAMSLIARFRVDGFEPRQVSDLDVDWFGVLTFAKTFTEGIVGEATTVFLSSGDEGSRSYVAVERITGHIEDGADGSVTVQHGGLESDPDTWFGHIVPGTGTGGFAGWQGSARIRHDDGGAFFVIDLT